MVRVLQLCNRIKVNINLIANQVHKGRMCPSNVSPGLAVLHEDSGMPCYSLIVKLDPVQTLGTIMGANA